MQVTYIRTLTLLSVYYKNVKCRISFTSNIEFLFTDYRHTHTGSKTKHRAWKSSFQGKYNVMLPSSLIQMYLSNMKLNMKPEKIHT